jgi:predicted DNA-binding transcriptional regulator YafY
MTASDLGSRLDVTGRTILRDIESLSVAGVPVVTVRGREGGFELLQGFRPMVTALTADESQALFAGISAASAESLGLGRTFASAVRKVLAAVPEPSRPAAVVLADRILVDPDGWFPSAVLPLLAAAQDAVVRGRRMRIRYAGRDDDSPATRTLDPYGLVNSAGTWYLVGYHRGTVKFFRLSRISHITVLETAASYPAHVDLGKLWRERRESFQARFEPVVVRALIPASKLTEVRERSVALERTGDSVVVDGVEWPEVAVTFGDPRHALGVLVGLGGNGVVLEPAHMRERLQAHAEAILARAGCTSTSDP